MNFWHHGYGWHHGGVALLFVLAFVALALLEDTRRALAAVAIVALFLVLSCGGCSTVVERPDGEEPAGFCERHSQGCVTTGVAVGTAALFGALVLDARHGNHSPPPATGTGGPGTPCVLAGCVQ